MFYIVMTWILVVIVSILCIAVGCLLASNSTQNIINQRILDALKGLAKYIDGKQEKH